MPVFLPVQIAAERPPSSPLPIPAQTVPAAAEAARVEITLPDGTSIRVGADIGLATLRRVMSAVRR